MELTESLDSLEDLSTSGSSNSSESDEKDTEQIIDCHRVKKKLNLDLPYYNNIFHQSNLNNYPNIPDKIFGYLRGDDLLNIRLVTKGLFSSITLLIHLRKKVVIRICTNCSRKIGRLYKILSRSTNICISTLYITFIDPPDTKLDDILDIIQNLVPNFNIHAIFKFQLKSESDHQTEFRNNKTIFLERHKNMLLFRRNYLASITFSLNYHEMNWTWCPVGLPCLETLTLEKCQDMKEERDISFLSKIISVSPNLMFLSVPNFHFLITLWSRLGQSAKNRLKYSVEDEYLNFDLIQKVNSLDDLQIYKQTFEYDNLNNFVIEGKPNKFLEFLCINASSLEHLTVGHKFIKWDDKLGKIEVGPPFLLPRFKNLRTLDIDGYPITQVTKNNFPSLQKLIIRGQFYKGNNQFTTFTNVNLHEIEIIQSERESIEKFDLNDLQFNFPLISKLHLTFNFQAYSEAATLFLTKAIDVLENITELIVKLICNEESNCCISSDGDSLSRSQSRGFHFKSFFFFINLPHEKLKKIEFHSNKFQRQTPYLNDESFDSGLQKLPNLTHLKLIHVAKRDYLEWFTMNCLQIDELVLPCKKCQSKKRLLLLKSLRPELKIYFTKPACKLHIK